MQAFSVTRQADVCLPTHLETFDVAIQTRAASARAVYQDFLTLWKDADLDIPIPKQAKAEYAELK